MKVKLNDKIERQPMFICGTVHRLFRNKVTTLLSEKQLMTLEMSRALVAVKENQPLSQQQLADIVQNERSATKRMVDNLEKRGYLTTYKSETNKKLKMLSLTELGDNELEKAKQTIVSVENEIFDCLTAEEFDVFLDLIRKIGAAHLG